MVMESADAEADARSHNVQVRCLRHFDVARSLHAPTINIRYLLEVYLEQEMDGNNRPSTLPARRPRVPLGSDD